MTRSARPSSRRRAAFGAVLCAFVAFPAVAPAQDFAGKLEDFRKQHGIPGLSCAIAVGERIVFAEGFGTADLENDVPATAATVYRLASISKPIAAIARTSNI